MNTTNGNGVKYIDGIYRQPKKSNLIQVALPLDTSTEIPVKWQKNASKMHKQAVSKDKFYVLATAALTGTKPKVKTSFRLRRLRTPNQLTIAEATKRAEALKETNVIKPKNRTILTVLKNAFVYLKTFFSNLAAKVIQKTRSIFKHFSVHSLLILQTIIIILLGVGLTITLYSYQHYKSTTATMIKAEREKSDAQWQQLQASWQCISDKWKLLQENPSAVNQEQREVTC